MKIWLSLLSVLIFNISTAQTKHALLVAVGEYPPGGKWKNLSSENDVKYMKQALIKNGFAEKNIDTVKNEKATKNNILQALDDLYKKVNINDIVIFHFSGHGQQIEDNNGDEPDGYDEALVAYDAKATYDPVSYTGQNHLRDDELQPKLAAIRNKIGSNGSLLVTIDACHSGTATRSQEFAICRGEPVPFKSPGYAPKNNVNVTALSDGFDAGDNSSNMIVFSASSPNQVNYETKDGENNGVGSLSYAFAKALTDLPSNSDYELLFQKIKSQIQAQYPMQIPMMEGNGRQQILSGAYNKREEFINVSKWLNDSTFIINVGHLNNINKGSTFKVFNAANETVADGRIDKVSSFQSIGIANKKLGNKDAYHIKWDAVSNGAFSASVFINNKGKKTTTVEKQLSSMVKSQPYLGLSSNADFMLHIEEAKNEMQVSLIERGDSIRWKTSLVKEDTLSAEKRSALLASIKNAMQVKYLRSLTDGGTIIEGVKVEIKPRVQSNNPNEILMKAGDEFSLTITNSSPYNLYYTIIDIMPDNQAKVLLPEETATPQDYIITAGSKPFTIDGIFVDEGTPTGKEVFKIIFSKSPIDLRSVFNKSATRTRSNMLSFEQALTDVFADNTTTTRAGISNVKVDDVGILTVGFTITNH